MATVAITGQLRHVPAPVAELVRLNMTNQRSWRDAAVVYTLPRAHETEREYVVRLLLYKTQMRR